MKPAFLPLPALAALLLSASAPSTNAATSFSLNDGVGTPTSGTYSPGNTFSLSVTLTVGGNTVPNDITGYSLFFDVAQANASFFSINGFTLLSASFSDPTSSPTTAQPFNTADRMGFLANASDLGATTAGGTSVPAGSYLVETITFQIAANAPAGTYTLQTTTATAGGRGSGSSDSAFSFFTAPSAAYTITVVPEPSTWALCATAALGFGAVGLRRRRG